MTLLHPSTKKDMDIILIPNQKNYCQLPVKEKFVFLLSLGIQTTLKEDSMPSSRWPVQNEHIGIFGGILLHVAVLSYF